MNDLVKIIPKKKDLGGFSVRRALPDIKKRSIGPFVFFDHMGPAEFSAGEGIDVRPHPHIGLATITYLFEGEFRHRDSVGSDQMVYPGEVNWMIAGRGITHSERTSAATRAEAHKLHGIQTWVALPESHERTEPAFQHLTAGQLAKWSENGIQFTLVLGDWKGKTTPVKTFSPMHYLVMEADKVGRHELEPAPETHESGLYLAEGCIVIANETFQAGSLLLLPQGRSIEIEITQTPTRMVRVGGVNLGYRHLWWNFVASNKALIEEAKIAYEEGKMPLPPGDDEEWIPLPR